MYGCRVICFAGGCICALGFALSMLSQNILTFILTYGVLGGRCCLFMIPFTAIVEHNFLQCQ